jgi:thiol-disulfide isomerase/thioredoxin
VPEPATQSAAIPNWALVAAAAGLVLALSIVEQRRAGLEVAPRIALPRLDGDGTLGVEPGAVTLVDFWATWCGPCRASMPRLQRLYGEVGPKGVRLLSVDTDAESPGRAQEVRQFLADNRLSFPVVLDDGSGSEALRVSSLPTLFLIDKDGRVLWRHVGTFQAADEAVLRSLIDAALAR